MLDPAGLPIAREKADAEQCAWPLEWLDASPRSRAP